MEKFLVDDPAGSTYKTLDMSQLTYTAVRLLLDLDGPKVKAIKNTGDIAKQMKVQDFILGLTRLAMRHAVMAESTAGNSAGLKLLYPSSLEPEAMLLVPSRTAIKAVLDLEVQSRYTEDDVSYTIDASGISSWKARLSA